MVCVKFFTRVGKLLALTDRKYCHYIQIMKVTEKGLIDNVTNAMFIKFRINNNKK